MSDAARFNIASQRNEDFGPFEGRFTDADGQPTQMQGWLWELHIDPELDPATPLLVITSTANGYGSRVATLEPDFGRVGLFIAKEDIAALPGEPEDDATFYFNLISIEPDGTRRIFSRGRFIAEPGIGMFDSGGGLLVTEDDDFFKTENDEILRY